MKKGIFAVLGIGVISGLLFAFQNCAKSGSSDVISGKSDTLAGKSIVRFTLDLDSGYTPREDYFSVSINLDFSTKLVVGATERGSKVSKELPASGTKTLTDSEVSQIRGLLDEITFEECTKGMMIFDAPVSRMNVFGQQGANWLLSNTYCSGGDQDNVYKIKSGYIELLAGLKKILGTTIGANETLSNKAASKFKLGYMRGFGLEENRLEVAYNVSFQQKQKCPTGSPILDGGWSGLHVFGNDLQTPDFVLHYTDCTGIGEPTAYKIKAGYNELLDELKFLADR